MPLMQTKEDVAQVILRLNYGELMALGRELSAMKEPDVRPSIETPEEYAALLFDWAESAATEATE